MDSAAVQHTALPRWVTAVQDHALLTCLILAEAYLLGTLMTLGWVPNIEDPYHWGIFHGIGVALFFAAGATAAGVALRCSVASAAAFTQHAWGRALFNFLGLLVFSVAEIWASLSERSQHLTPTPADNAVLNLLGLQGVPVSPTVLIVALLLPFASLYWGFAQQPKTVEESAEDMAARQARELAEDAHKQRRKAVKAAGRRTRIEAYAGRVNPLESVVASPVESLDEDTGIAETEPITLPLMMTPQPAAMPSEGAASSPRNDTPHAPVKPKGASVPGYMMTSPQFRAELAKNGVFITPEQAVAVVKSCEGYERYGVTYAAFRNVLMGRAKTMIAAAQSTGNERAEESA